LGLKIPNPNPKPRPNAQPESKANSDHTSQQASSVKGSLQDSVKDAKDVEVPSYGGGKGNGYVKKEKGYVKKEKGYVKKEGGSKENEASKQGSRPPEGGFQVSTLPIDAHKERIMSSIERHQVSIIQGETGCGKSSRMPIMMYEHGIETGNKVKMMVAQPRRIAAHALLERAKACGHSDVVGMRMGHGVREGGKNVALWYVTTGAYYSLALIIPLIIPLFINVITLFAKPHLNPNPNPNLNPNLNLNPNPNPNLNPNRRLFSEAMRSSSRTVRGSYAYDYR